MARREFSHGARPACRPGSDLVCWDTFTSPDLGRYFTGLHQAHPMNKPTRVALQGFSRAERSTFESFFALAGQRTPSYVQEADPSRAHFILVDADDASSCELLATRGLMRRAVALGTTLRPEALMQLPRPINLMLVVRALDALPRSAARPRTPSGADPHAMVDAGDTQPSDAIERVLQELAYRTVALPGGVDYRTTAQRAAPEPAAMGSPAAAREARPRAGVDRRAPANANNPDVWVANRASSPRALAPQAPLSASGPSASVAPSPATLSNQRASSGTAPVRPAPPPGSRGSSTRTSQPVRPASTVPPTGVRAEADLAPDLARPAAGAAGDAMRPFANTEAPIMTSVDIPVWADARAITASLAAQAAAEAWPTISAPPDTSAALWLPDLQASPPAAAAPASPPAVAPAEAPLPAPVSARLSAQRLSPAPAGAGAGAGAASASASTSAFGAPTGAASATSSPPTGRATAPTVPTRAVAAPDLAPAPPAGLTAALAPSDGPTPVPMSSRTGHPHALPEHDTADEASNPFPALPPLEAPHSAMPPTAQPSTASLRDTTGNAHVLVVDDGELALRFITTQLKRYGFQVHVAREPREALAQLQARRYEFVFIEINLEADNNFGVTQAIRQAAHSRDDKAPAVVLLADRHSNSELQTAANAGADAWLTTPLMEADLLKLVGPRSAPRAKTEGAELSSAASA